MITKPVGYKKPKEQAHEDWYILIDNDIEYMLDHGE